jgi:hypothetical protein
MYSFLNITRQNKSRRMTWVDHVARMGGGSNVYRVLVGTPEGKRTLGRSRMESKWILRRLAGRVSSGFTWLRIGIAGGLL